MRFLLRLFALLVSVACLAPGAPGQEPAEGKRPLTLADCDGWKSLSGTAMTDDGAFMATSYAAQDGDPLLVVVEVEGERRFEHPRGQNPSFTADGRYCIFAIAPAKAEVRAHKLAELRRKKEKEEFESAPASAPRGEGRRGRPRGRRGARAEAAAPEARGAGDEDSPEEPKPSVGILDLATGSVRVIERTKGFRVLETGPPVIAVHLEKPKPAKKEPAEAEGAESRGEGLESRPESRAESSGAVETMAAESGPEPESLPESGPESRRKKDPAEKRRKEGTPLLLLDLAAGTETRVEGVVTVAALRKRPVFHWHCSSKKDDAKVEPGLFAFDGATSRRTTLLSGILECGNFTTDREETRLVFLSNRDDIHAEKPVDAVYAWDFAADAAIRIVDRTTPGFPPDRAPLATHLALSKDGGALLVGAGALPEPEPAPMLEEDRVNLDLWNWRDGYLQPMQQKRAAALRARAIPCVWHFAENRLASLGSDDYDGARFITRDGSRVLLTTSGPWRQLVSWDTDYEDVFVANSIDGTVRRLLTRHRDGVRISPDGTQIVWFGPDRHWYGLDVATMAVANLTRGIDVPLVNEDWDLPAPPRAVGIAGWVEGEGSLLVYDRYDIWEVGAERDPVCVTDGFGRANRIVLRAHRLDREAEHFATGESLFLLADQEETRSSGIWRDRLRAAVRPERVVSMDKDLGFPSKAKKADRLFFTISTFEEFPDLWTSDLEFRGLRRLTDANPQQKEFRWGRAETVRWLSADGKPLRGNLIKPEGFDPGRKYPMMVYFYEKLSDRVHAYRPPAPGTSPNPAFYVSQGYLWFEPDIVYEVGHPGESCFKCVVSGVQSLVARGFVDEKAIGIAGHSWGGYQVSYLVTRTNLFTAAEAGAPVSNMVSAYGGIRWGTGMSRAFQYEQSQSRIGATLWEAPLRFIENSPIFRADSVRTPLLILHNDQDGAVPWYQGIEYFVALRRLGREAYLFNYTAEDHGLSRRANMKDWTLRMFQFFEHHLRGAPAPAWMTEGVPYIEREAEKRSFLPPPPPPVPAPEPAERENGRDS